LTDKNKLQIQQFETESKVKKAVLTYFRMNQLMKCRIYFLLVPRNYFCNWI